MSRKLGENKATFYWGRQERSGRKLNQLKALAKENGRLQRTVSDLKLHERTFAWATALQTKRQRTAADKRASYVAPLVAAYFLRNGRNCGKTSCDTFLPMKGSWWP